MNIDSRTVMELLGQAGELHDFIVEAMAGLMSEKEAA